ncbi:MAG: PAS domain-containing protein [Alphaproteobacteria bacterium]|nr:PAS domain-containing protein [Alphaproteobacteria bacterium]
MKEARDPMPLAAEVREHLPTRRPIWHPAFWGLVLILAVFCGIVGYLLNIASIERPLMTVIVTAVAALSLLTLGVVYGILGRKAGMESSDAFWRQTRDLVSTGRLVTGPSGGVVYANEAFFEMFEVDSSDPLNSLEKNLSGIDAERFRRIRLKAGIGEAASDEIAVADPAGLQWRNLSAFPIENIPGYIYWRAEDTTARHEMEQIIREEQDKLVDFLENAPVGFYSVDENGQFLFVNNQFAEWLGLPPSTLVGGERRLHDFMEDEPQPETPLYTFFGGDGMDSHGEVRLRNARGETFQAFVTQTIVPMVEGQGLRTRSVVRNLTPERKWEQALRQSELRFKQFFEEAPIGIVFLDLDLRIVECNGAFRQIAGMAPMGKGGDNDPPAPLLRDLIDEKDKEVLLHQIERVASGIRPSRPIEVRLKGEQNMVAAFFIRRLEDAKGEASGFILHTIEMTEQKKLEQQFAQKQKMELVGRLAGGVAHDFNNLLTAMIGNCDLLLLNHGPGDQAFADIMQIKQNANRAANLVRQLLAFSRQQTLQPKVLNVTDVLGELTNLLNRLLGERIELEIVHGQNLGYVKVDQGQLEQVIINLVVNARDAMQGGGRLVIQTSNLANPRHLPTPGDQEPMPPGDYVLIDVEDTGAGISGENLERIFEPFFTTKELGSGTGLGLSTVYGIVRQTGGFIFVNSVIGEGTKFSIYLPRHQMVEAAAGAHTVTTSFDPVDLTGVGTVLLVEDEDAVRLFGARALRKKGYKVLEAKGGYVALDLINNAEEPIDLLITDVVMPELDGPSLVHRVLETRPDMKVIFISGYAEDSFRDRIGDLPDLHFLTKPFSLEQLAGKVKEVMAN